MKNNAAHTHGRGVLSLAAVIAGCLCGLSACGFSQDDPGTSQGDSIRPLAQLVDCTVRMPGYYYLGALLPYEGAWPVGAAHERAIIQAIDEINVAGGVHDRPLGLVLCNTKGDSATAGRAAEELVSTSEVAAIIGPLRTEEAEGVRPAVDRTGIVAMLPAASGFEAMGSPWFYRLAPSSEQLGAVATAIAKSMGVFRVSVFSVDDTDSRKMAAAFIDDCKQPGVGIGVEAHSYAVQDPSFASGVITAARMYGPQAVVLVGYGDDAASIVRAAQDRSFEPSSAGGWVFSPAIKTRKFLDSIGDTNYIDGARGVGTSWSQNPNYQSFMSTYEQLWGLGAPDEFASQSYDAAYILAIAMSFAAVPDDRVDLRDHLASAGQGSELHPGQWTLMQDLGSSGSVAYVGASGAFSPNDDNKIATTMESWIVTGGDFITNGCWTANGEACENQADTMARTEHSRRQP